MSPRRYLMSLLWGNFKLYCPWLYVGRKDFANEIANDAGTFVRAYLDGKL